MMAKKSITTYMMPARAQRRRACQRSNSRSLTQLGLALGAVACAISALRPDEAPLQEHDEER